MTEPFIQAPPEEQKICVACGLCCDATVFLHAHIKAKELGEIPERMKDTLFLEKGENYFVQPCPYFAGKCTIYNQKRAEVCCTYRCQLLKDFEAGRITLEMALSEVSDARAMRDDIISDFCQLTGNGEPVPFRRLLIDMHRILKSEGAATGLRMETLQARCNIFEALIIKHFRSRDDFEKMIMK